MERVNTRIAIASALLDSIIAEAAKLPNEEVCGLLLGGDARIDAAVAARNVAADPTCRFEIDPQTLFAVIRAERAGGARLIGHYHSHPGGSASPSAADAAEAVPGALWLIVAGDKVAIFQSIAGGSIYGMFNPLALDAA